MQYCRRVGRRPTPWILVSMAAGAVTSLVVLVVSAAADASPPLKAPPSNVASIAASAASSGTSPSTVTEEHLLATLERDHPALADARQRWAEAQAWADEARRFDNPEFGWQREDLSGPTSTTEWSLGWQLPGWRRGLDIQRRQQEVEQARASYDAVLRQLRHQVRADYAHWAVAVTRGEALERQAGQLEALAQRETRRAEKGEAAGLDARRLTLAALALRQRWHLQQAQVEIALGEIRRWVPELAMDARPTLPPLPPVSSDGAPDGGPDGARRSDVQEQETHELRAARFEISAAQLEQDAAQRSVDSPRLELGWQREDEGLAAVDGPVVGLSWSVPLFRRGQAQRQLAEARLTAAQGRLEDVLRQQTARKAAARQTYRRLRSAALAANPQSSDLESLREGAEAAFRLGEGSLTDWLDTVHLVTDVELTHLDLYAAALEAHRDLEVLVGMAPATTSSSQSCSPECPQ